MKKIYCLFCLLFLHLIGHAQFFALEYDSVNPYVTVLPYPRDGYYRVVSYDHRFPASPVFRTRIKVYDPALQYIKTINLLKGITLVNDCPPLLHNNHLLWPANFNDTIENVRNSLVILELDTNYKFIALHKLSTHNNRAQPTGIVAYSKGFVVGEYFNGPNVSSTGFSTRVYKLNLSLQKKDSVLLPDELRLKTHRSYNNKIVGASDNISSACTATVTTTQKIVLDTNLVIADCLNLPASWIMFCYDAGGNMTTSYAIKYKTKGIVFPISNYRNYVHAETDHHNCPLPGINKAIFSTAFKGNIAGNSYLNSHDTADTEFPLYLASDCDYFGANTIYVGNVGLKNNYSVDKIFYRPYYAKLKTKMTVIKSDTLGNSIWKYEYGGEMNYFARSVAFTPDGGCVIAGSRYDSVTFYPNKVFQNFMMRIDSAGNMGTVGIKENSIALTKIKCFPNPANSTIYFDLPFQEHINIQIFNELGQLVLEKKNYVNHSQLNIEDLEKGMYAYKISTSKNQFAGKLVKE